MTTDRKVQPKAKQKNLMRKSAPKEGSHDLVPEDGDYIDQGEIRRRAIEDANKAVDKFVGELQ